MLNEISQVFANTLQKSPISDWENYWKDKVNLIKKFPIKSYPGRKRNTNGPWEYLQPHCFLSYNDQPIWIEVAKPRQTKPKGIVAVFTGFKERVPPLHDLYAKLGFWEIRIPSRHSSLFEIKLPFLNTKEKPFHHYLIENYLDSLLSLEFVKSLNLGSILLFHGIGFGANKALFATGFSEKPKALFLKDLTIAPETQGFWNTEGNSLVDLFKKFPNPELQYFSVRPLSSKWKSPLFAVTSLEKHSTNPEPTFSIFHPIPGPKTMFLDSRMSECIHPPEDWLEESLR